MHTLHKRSITSRNIFYISIGTRNILYTFKFQLIKCKTIKNTKIKFIIVNILTV